MNIKKNLYAAENWILYSGIQERGEDPAVHGCFHAWYSSAGYAFPYPEITGYALSTLVLIAKNHPSMKNKALDVGERAIRYLNDNCLRDGHNACKPHRISNGRDDLAYTFDVGMILKGLFHFYELFQGEIPPYCFEICEWLKNMQKTDGSFYAYYNTAADEKKDTPERWSSQPGPHHAKLAMIFNMSYHYTGRKEYIDLVRHLTDWTLNRQNDGRFITDSERQNTFLHAQCYALEGIMAAQDLLEDESLFGIFSAGIRWILEMFSLRNGLPSNICGMQDDKEERSDILAQVIRLTCLLDKNDHCLEHTIDELMSRLLLYQDDSNDFAAMGGFHFRRFLDSREDDKSDHINTWSTLVSYESMLVYDRYKHRDTELSITV